MVQIASSGVSMMAMAWDTLNLQSDKRQREKRQILEGSCISMGDNMSVCIAVYVIIGTVAAFCVCVQLQRENFTCRQMEAR